MHSIKTLFALAALATTTTTILAQNTACTLEFEQSCETTLKPITNNCRATAGDTQEAATACFCTNAYDVALKCVQQCPDQNVLPGIKVYMEFYGTECPAWMKNRTAAATLDTPTTTSAAVATTRERTTTTATVAPAKTSAKSSANSVSSAGFAIGLLSVPALVSLLQ
ncbi:hypothetical protein HDV05_000188 [Chytridiales sp. JEL 0842]|nr:hypothetical protein HDV05_000188 [Chytridiales sp. JEL 0842]